MEFLFVIARVLFGGYFIMSGYKHITKGGHLIGYAASKKVPNPKMAVLLSGILVLLGGLGILFWVYVDWSVFFIILFLVPVTFMMHDFWSEKDQMTRMNSYIGFTKNIALIGGALAFLFA